MRYRKIQTLRERCSSQVSIHSQQTLRSRAEPVLKCGAWGPARHLTHGRLLCPLYSATPPGAPTDVENINHNTPIDYLLALPGKMKGSCQDRFGRSLKRFLGCCCNLHWALLLQIVIDTTKPDEYPIQRLENSMVCYELWGFSPNTSASFGHTT